MNEKEMLREIAKNGKMTEFAQGLVNATAKMIIKLNPELAENDPQEVGRIAKEAVITRIAQIANS